MITFGYNAGSTVQGTFTIYSADNQFDKELVSEPLTQLDSQRLLKINNDLFLLAVWGSKWTS